MKKSELIAAVEKSAPIVLAEWRSGELIELSGTSEKSGKPYVIKQIVHNVEIGGKSYKIKEKLDDKIDVKSYKLPFLKGQMVVVTLDLFDQGKGAWRVSGKFEPYSAAA